jgi:phage terminase small subunit
VCRLLEDHGLLEASDQGDIVCLAIARAQLSVANDALKAGRYTVERVPGMFVKCVACRGDGTRTGGQKCKACRGRGVLQKQGRIIKHRRPETQDLKDAQEAIIRLSAALGLDPTSRVRIKGKIGGQPTSGLQEFLKTRATRA